MAVYRNVSISFWNDSKVVDDFTPEDKYFYLYLFTNPHTNLCGCYEISIKQMAYETGYGKETVEKLLCRLETIHKVISYCGETKELLIHNWYKYNWTSSEKFRKPLFKEIESIKDDSFRGYLTEIFNGNDTVSIPYSYGSDTTVTVSVTDTVTDTVSVTDSVKEIIGYMNEICGTQYKPNTKKNRELIQARMNEGFTVEDFKTVIYKKARQWKDDKKMCQYLRPITLFSPKFESYLNEKEAGGRLDWLDAI